MYLTEVVVFWTIIDTDDADIHVRMCAHTRAYAHGYTRSMQVRYVSYIIPYAVKPRN